MSSLSASGTHHNGMLPTPNKTPNKRPTHAAPGIASIARNLFPVRAETVEEVMPSPRKKSKKYGGYSLGNFSTDGDNAPIAIYTDSKDRVPEVDMSVDNPFYGEEVAAPTTPATRSSRRRMIKIPGEGDQSLEEAEKRTDGLVYVLYVSLAPS